MDDDTYDCCEFGSMVTTDDGDVVYPDLCDCICHWEDRY